MRTSTTHAAAAVGGWLRLAGCAALVALGAFVGLASGPNRYFPLFATSAAFEGLAIALASSLAGGERTALRRASWAVLAVAGLVLMHAAVGAVSVGWSG